MHFCLVTVTSYIASTHPKQEREPTAGPILDILPFKVPDSLELLGHLPGQDDLHAAVGDTTIRAVLGRAGRVIDSRVDAKFIGHAALVPYITTDLASQIHSGVAQERKETYIERTGVEIGELGAIGEQWRTRT
jgi:hypothetical protein